MTSSTSRVVSATRVVPAAPAEIFALLSDAARHGDIDGSGMVQSARGGATALTLGTKFGMNMKMGRIPYRIKNTVVEFEKDRLIAWAHLGGHRWRYELAPVDGGTEVTESFDWSTAKIPPLIERAGYPRKNLVAIERTLDRLVALFTTS